MPTPHISIVIPAYNEEKYIGKCLEAITQQDYPHPYQIIVVDNNCTDQTINIAKKFPVEIIQEKHQGLIPAKQTGCSYAKAPIIAVLDADNIPFPDWLTTIHQNLSKSDIVGVTGPYLLPNHAPQWAISFNQIAVTLNTYSQKMIKNALQIWGGNVAFKKEVFDQFGGYDTSYNFAADQIQLLNSLKQYGQVIQDKSMSVLTSTRRIAPGAKYFFLEFCLKNYVANYLLTKYTHRPLQKPIDIREKC